MICMSPFAEINSKFDIPKNLLPATPGERLSSPALRAAAILKMGRIESPTMMPRPSVEKPSSCPRASSTRFTTLQKQSSPEKQPSPFAPQTFNAGYFGDDHWTYTDPLLFDALPQGGGGIDWLTITVEGHLTEEGIAFEEMLSILKPFIRSGQRQGQPLRIVDLRRGHDAVIEIPESGGCLASVAASSTGSGRTYQPHLLRCEGIAVRYGAVERTYPSSGGKSGPVAFVELPGTVFLRHGEAGALELLHSVLLSLGIHADKMKVTRLDVCADLPGVDVAAFNDVIDRREYITRSRAEFQRWTSSKTGKVTSIRLQTDSTTMRIYDKMEELRKGNDSPKQQLMSINRHGTGCVSATRVEFQFSLSHLRALKFGSIEELLSGLATLVEWATMSWFKCCEVADRRHTERAMVSDIWLRTLHAFSWWCGRLRSRAPQAPTILQPPEMLIKQAVGTFAAALARSGIYVEDDITAWTVLAGMVEPGELTDRIRAKSDALRARHGSVLRFAESTVTLRGGSALEPVRNDEGREDDERPKLASCR